MPEEGANEPAKFCGAHYLPAGVRALRLLVIAIAYFFPKNKIADVLIYE